MTVEGLVTVPSGDFRSSSGDEGFALQDQTGVEGTVTQEGVQDDLPYGYKLDIDDGTGPVQIYLNASAGIDPRSPDLKPGRKICVTGFSNKYDTTYEVDPRSRRDLRSCD